MKVVFAGVLSVCVFAAIKLYSHRDKRQIRQCESFLSFLNFAKSQVRFSSKTVLEICRAFSEMSEHALPFLEHCSEPVVESVRDNLEKEKALSDKQKSVITAFFSEFGRADEEGSLACAENYYYLFSTEFESAREECLKRIKLMNKLALLSAAAVVIIFI